jgi:hypothetical protein
MENQIMSHPMWKAYLNEKKLNKLRLLYALCLIYKKRFFGISKASGTTNIWKN